ncbi:hypothetical protein [Promicromonospora sp. NPDC057488]|uniref:hypothetical protein n=1 Tax=Promicromonospora sp. NPDC057488 TaxID=3346147 RepID=UPI0036719C50
MRSYRSSFYRATAICVLGAVSVTGVGVAAHAAPSAPAGTYQTAAVASSSATPTESVPTNAPAPNGVSTPPSGNLAPIEVQSRFSWIRDIIKKVAPAAWNALKNAATKTWNALVSAWNSLAGWIKTAIVVAAQETALWILETIWNYFN